MSSLKNIRDDKHSGFQLLIPSSTITVRHTRLYVGNFVKAGPLKLVAKMNTAGRTTYSCWIVLLLSVFPGKYRVLINCSCFNTCYKYVIRVRTDKNAPDWTEGGSHITHVNCGTSQSACPLDTIQMTCLTSDFDYVAWRLPDGSNILLEEHGQEKITQGVFTATLTDAQAVIAQNSPPLSFPQCPNSRGLVYMLASRTAQYLTLRLQAYAQ